jgi:hypothetical protein
MVGPFQRAVAVLRERAPASLWWRFALMPGEDHGSTPHRSTYDALEAIFEPLRVPPDDSIIAAGVAGVDRHFAALRARFGFPAQTPELAINRLGYLLLQDSSRHAAAIEAFRENVRRHPTSANTYDSLGDGYRRSATCPPRRRATAPPCGWDGPRRTRGEWCGTRSSRRCRPAR